MWTNDWNKKQLSGSTIRDRSNHPWVDLSLASLPYKKLPSTICEVTIYNQISSDWILTKSKFCHNWCFIHHCRINKRNSCIQNTHKQLDDLFCPMVIWIKGFYIFYNNCNPLKSIYTCVIYMCVCVCMYMYIYTHTYTYTYTYIHTHIYIYIYIYIHTHT